MNKHTLVILLLCMTLLGVSGTDIYISSLPQMMHDFNTTQSLINSTILCFNSGMAISVLFTGILSNRFGRKPVIVTGLLTFSIASFIIAISPTIWMVLALRCAQGAGCGGIIIVQRLILRDIMDENEQIHAGGILVLGSIISPAIAPVIGAFLAKMFGWHSCFLLSGILGTIITIFTIKIVEETNSTPIKRLPRLIAYLKDYVVLLSDPVCLNLISILCLTFAAYFAFLGVSSYLYIMKLGLSPITYSYIFILLAGGYFIGNSYMMYLNKHRYTPSQIIKQGVIGGIIGFIVLGFSTLFNNHGMIIICLTSGVMIMRIASALILNPAQIKIANHFKTRGALALGLAICMQFGVAGIAAAGVGFFSQQQLLEGFICLSGVCMLLSGLSYMIMRTKE